MKVGFVTLGRIRHQSELGDTQNLPVYILDASFPHLSGVAGIIENTQCQDFLSDRRHIGQRIICPVPIPTSTISPLEIFEMTSPSTVTDAEATLCMTALIFQPAVRVAINNSEST